MNMEKIEYIETYMYNVHVKDRSHLLNYGGGNYRSHHQFIITNLF